MRFSALLAYVASRSVWHLGDKWLIAWRFLLCLVSDTSFIEFSHESKAFQRLEGVKLWWIIWSGMKIPTTQIVETTSDHGHSSGMCLKLSLMSRIILWSNFLKFSYDFANMCEKVMRSCSRGPWSHETSSQEFHIEANFHFERSAASRTQDLGMDSVLLAGWASWKGDRLSTAVVDLH